MNLEPIREITQDEVAQYLADGIILLKGLFDNDWIDHLIKSVANDIANPGPMHRQLEDDGDSGSFFYETIMWTYNDDFRRFVFESPAARVVAQLMNSRKVNIYYDQLLIKEPGTSKITPWHHDMPYLPIRGDQFCTMWLALDRVTDENGAVEYIRGSHKWGKVFNPMSFKEGRDYEHGLESIPDIDAKREDFDIVQYDLEPGDCTVHHALLVHAAPGNKRSERRRRGYITRWAGDDVTYFPAEEGKKLQNLIFDPGISPGAPLDSKLWPVVWQQS